MLYNDGLYDVQGERNNRLYRNKLNNEKQSLTIAHQISGANLSYNFRQLNCLLLTW